MSKTTPSIQKFFKTEAKIFAESEWFSANDAAQRNTLIQELLSYCFVVSNDHKENVFKSLGNYYTNINECVSAHTKGIKIVKSSTAPCFVENRKTFDTAIVALDVNADGILYCHDLLNIKDKDLK